MKSYLIFISGVVLAFGGLATSCDTQQQPLRKGAYYTCPMHPEVRKQAPGQCPVCHMDLVEREGDSGQNHKPASSN